MHSIARRRAARRRVLCFFGLLALVVAPTAFAHLVYTSGTNAKGPICVNGGSGIAEDPPQVIAEGWTQSYAQGYCLTAKNMPAYSLALRRQLYFWNGSAWSVCANSGWQYNESPTSYKSIFRQWSQMPCGQGWYNHLAESYAYYNGQWLGGYRFAGNHYF
jgi:hypothetical protein